MPALSDDLVEVRRRAPAASKPAEKSPTDASVSNSGPRPSSALIGPWPPPRRCASNSTMSAGAGSRRLRRAIIRTPSRAEMRRSSIRSADARRLERRRDARADRRLRSPICSVNRRPSPPSLDDRPATGRRRRRRWRRSAGVGEDGGRASRPALCGRRSTRIVIERAGVGATGARRDGVGADRQSAGSLQETVGRAMPAPKSTSSAAPRERCPDRQIGRSAEQA